MKIVSFFDIIVNKNFIKCLQNYYIFIIFYSTFYHLLWVFDFRIYCKVKWDIIYLNPLNIGDTFIIIAYIDGGMPEGTATDAGNIDKGVYGGSRGELN